MINCLYEGFKAWSEGGRILLISDPHFNDKDCKLMNPNWVSPDEYVKYLNSVVTKNDTLVCLGDCGDISYFNKIRAGYKVLIKGNHDEKNDDYYRKHTIIREFPKEGHSRAELLDMLRKEYPEDYSITVHTTSFDYKAVIQDKLFNEVYSGAIIISKKIILSHEKVLVPFALNIHGHEHGGSPELAEHKLFYYGNSSDTALGETITCYTMNIAADVVDFKVTDLSKIIEKGYQNKMPSIHRLAIEKQKKYGLERE